ncbi:hypothetical protein NL676_012463 [Syzygium grande]|nr:hypothetical protein NL676_012463 [Syzygium grande]
MSQTLVHTVVQFLSLTLLQLEEEDEALATTIVFHASKDYVRRIEDEDSEDEEDLTQSTACNDELLKNLKTFTC